MPTAPVSEEPVQAIAPPPPAHRRLRLQAEPVVFAAMLMVLTVGIHMGSSKSTPDTVDTKAAPPAQVATAG